MIFKYLEYPTEKEWNDIIKENESINNLYLNIKSYSYGKNEVLYFYYNNLLNEWLIQFNNRLGEIKITYIFLMHYFNKGIPDDRWACSGEKEGVKYYPDFEEKHFYYKLMFNYYVDVFYYKFFGAWDSISHIINIYYQMDVKTDLGFAKEVMGRLKNINKDLYLYLRSIQNNKIVDTARQLRNDLTHNFPPKYIRGMIEKEMTDEGIKISGKVGKYTTSKEFVDNINKSINLLDKCIESLELHLSL